MAGRSANRYDDLRVKFVTLVSRAFRILALGPPVDSLERLGSAKFRVIRWLVMDSNSTEFIEIRRVPQTKSGIFSRHNSRKAIKCHSK
jgi:hypothetical protein